jgi:hypothetical protein
MRAALPSVLALAGGLAALWVWCLVGAFAMPPGSLWRAIGVEVVTRVLS